MPHAFHDPRAALEGIKRLEAAARPMSLKVDGLDGWPLVRMMWHAWTRAIRPPDLTWDSVDYEPPAMDDPRLPGLLDQILGAAGGDLPPCDVLLLSHDKHALATVNGQAFDPMLDSLIALFGDRIRFLKVEMAAPGEIERANRWQAPLLVPDVLKAVAAPSTAPGRCQVEGFDAFAAAQEAVLGQRVIGRRPLLERTWRARGRYVVLRELLRRLRPRLVLHVDFATDHGMALSMAARDLGIPCADIQHGSGPMCMFNTKWLDWRVNPPGGYETMPSHFWLWTDGGREAVERTSNGQVPAVPVTGGNPWQALWADPVFASRHGGLGWALESRLVQASRVVLVCMPNVLEAWMSDVLIQAMRSAPDHWLWLIRLHPSDYKKGDEYRAMLGRWLADAGVANAEIAAEVSSLPLPALMRRADVVLSDHSGACLEARLRGLPAIIYGAEGRALFADLIDQGELGHATSPEDLVAGIEAACAVGARDVLFPDAARIEQALRGLMAQPAAGGGASARVAAEAAHP